VCDTVTNLKRVKLWTAEGHEVVGPGYSCPPVSNGLAVWKNEVTWDDDMQTQGHGIASIGETQANPGCSFT
jgi:hypothetical protein